MYTITKCYIAVSIAVSRLVWVDPSAREAPID
jgi:hypothetical protein